VNRVNRVNRLSRAVLLLSVMVISTAWVSTSGPRAEAPTDPPLNASEHDPDAGTFPDWSQMGQVPSVRDEFGRRDDFTSLCEMDRPLEAMVNAMNSDDWASATQLGTRWLAVCPVDLRVHYYLGIALYETGARDKAAAHFRWAQELADAIIQSGDGETCETAYFVISIAEEYDLLYVLGLKRRSQSLVQGKTGPCDLLAAETEEGQEVSIYFNPAPHFARLERLFDEHTERRSGRSPQQAD
jgi:hypothetical protein